MSFCLLDSLYLSLFQYKKQGKFQLYSQTNLSRQSLGDIMYNSFYGNIKQIKNTK